MIALVIQTGRVLAIRDQGLPGEEVYDCTCEICQSAVCPCREVTVVLTPASAAARTAWPTGAPIRVLVDPGMRCAIRGTDPDPASDWETSCAFASQFSDASWDWLWQTFAEVKAGAIETYDPKSDEVDFDIKRIEHEGLLIPFPAIFVHAPPILATMAGRTWMLDDQYCVRSSCQCTAVSAALKEVIGHKADYRFTWEFHIDYRAGTWHAADGKSALSAPAQAAQQALCAQHPDLFQEMAWRHGRLREMYAHARKTAGFVPAPAHAAAKPGRNDPCFCGSGKKYKRCCGSVNASAH